LWEGFKEDGDSEELAEVEAELDAAFKSNKGESKNKSKVSTKVICSLSFVDQILSQNVSSCILI
jgi:hypothetical protein